VLALARDLAADPRIDVLSITDNPGGHAMLSPDAPGTDVVNAAYLESKRQRRTDLRVPVTYRFSRRFPDTVFAIDAPLSEAYERLKACGEEESMLDGPVVVKDNALQGTSAWANTFLDRDHLARRNADPGERGATAP